MQLLPIGRGKDAPLVAGWLARLKGERSDLSAYCFGRCGVNLDPHVEILTPGGQSCIIGESPCNQERNRMLPPGLRIAPLEFRIVRLGLRIATWGSELTP